MSLLLSDQKPEDVLKLFDELDALTTPAFKSLKGEIDAALAAKYKIKPEELLPWHYQNRYFQEAPAIYDIDLDPYYKGKDIVKLTQDYYTSIGMEIGDMIGKSDLFEKPGKNQHAFCTDIDRDKHDIRVLCNVKDNQGWMETMLHEFGHAVYFKYHDTELPWVLKTPAHTFTTEAIAMFFGRMAMNAQWMLDMGIIKPEDKPKIEATAKKIMRLQQLVFSRWSQVMYRFEKGLYENPDQDLNKLWWDLAEKYQMIKKPTDRNMPDWATKIHIATSPCYYHNYHLGELLASQLYYYMKDKLFKMPAGEQASFFNNKDAGKFLIEKVFKPGALYYWDDMIEKATGEKLTAKYYAKQFVN
jgi:peptidyl-dipeptidase A